MSKTISEEILGSAKAFFKDKFAVNHVKNLKKLNKLSKFKYNPFLISYLGAFLTGKVDSESVAKGLIYPRILGTSPTTSFGTIMQQFTSQVLQKSFGSATSGIDIEFIDQIDFRKKYAQIKTGPNTVNYDDVETVKSKFEHVRRTARVNSLSIGVSDLIVGVLFGTEEKLNGNYKRINKDYPVIVGKDFWSRLTGDVNFYEDLIKAFGEVAREVNSKELLESTIAELSQDIKSKLEI